MLHASGLRGHHKRNHDPERGYSDYSDWFEDSDFKTNAKLRR